MPIKELKEPYWEKQNGETPNQFCYFQEYLKFPTFNLKDFHQHLCENYKNEHKPTAKPPKYNTIRGWSAENKWHIRKESKRTVEDQEILEVLHEKEKQQKIETFDAKQNIERELTKKIQKAIETGQPLSQINQGIQALKILNEDKQLTQEKPTNYNQTNIDAETRVQHQGVQELVEAFYVSKSEWDKRKQQ